MEKSAKAKSNNTKPCNNSMAFFFLVKASTLKANMLYLMGFSNTERRMLFEF